RHVGEILGIHVGRIGHDQVEALAGKPGETVALDGVDPLAEAADHLSEKGLLIVEVGNSEVHVQALYPEVDFTWLEFEHGGHGVFMLSAAQCREHRELFRSRLEK
ncbi:hypothetical protein ACV35Q_31670, partial [Pseudomonas aeruginosa]